MTLTLQYFIFGKYKYINMLKIFLMQLLSFVLFLKRNSDALRYRKKSQKYLKLQEKCFLLMRLKKEKRNLLLECKIRNFVF